MSELILFPQIHIYSFNFFSSVCIFGQCFGLLRDNSQCITSIIQKILSTQTQNFSFVHNLIAFHNSYPRKVYSLILPWLEKNCCGHFSVVEKLKPLHLSKPKESLICWFYVIIQIELPNASNSFLNPGWSKFFFSSNFNINNSLTYF
jgi:hypothetical protein